MLKTELLNLAALEAEKSPVKVATHGALVILRNKIIGRGYNNYNSTCKNIFSVHAEIQAINNALSKVSKHKLRDAKLVVVRLTKEGCLTNSFPCRNCQNYINKVGIHSVYYSDQPLVNCMEC